VKSGGGGPLTPGAICTPTLALRKQTADQAHGATGKMAWKNCSGRGYAHKFCHRLREGCTGVGRVREDLKFLTLNSRAARMKTESPKLPSSASVQSRGAWPHTLGRKRGRTIQGPESGVIW